MSVNDYIATLAPPPIQLRAMQQRAIKTGANRLSIRQIDRIVREVRRQQKSLAAKKNAK